MPAPGREAISSRPPSRRARSSIEVSPRRRPRTPGRHGVEAGAVVGDLEHEGPVALREPHRDVLGVRVAQGVVERLLGDAQHVGVAVAGGGPALQRERDLDAVQPAQHLDVLAQDAREPVAREVGRPQLADQPAQLLERLAGERPTRATCARAAAGSRASSVSAASALSTRLNSFWLTASWRSSASRLRSATTDSSRLRSYSRALVIAIAACAASSSMSSWSAASKAGAPSLW